MTGIEAMFDAMMAEEGWRAGSVSNRNRNPLNLRASIVTHKMDAGGYCVFGDILAGVVAGLEEVRAKVTGHNEHGIGPDSTLDQLFDVYAPRSDHNNPNAYALAVAEWCSTALGRAITHNSTLRAICPEEFNGG